MILVTGGTGLVGSHLLYELTSSCNIKIKATKRKTSSLDNLIKVFKQYTKDYQPLLDKIQWVNADLQDLSSLEGLFINIKTLYHCAALVSFNPEDKQTIYKTNMLGTQKLVDICINKKIRLCFVSSIGSLGNYHKQAICEKDEFEANKPHSIYSWSKYKSEQIVWEGIKKGLDAIIVNPSIILGFGHWNSGSSLLFKQVAEGLKFYTKGTTGYVDVRDVAKAMHQLTISDIKSERFILNAENLSYKSLFRLIAKHLNKPKPYIYASPIITGITWRILYIISKISKKKPNLTKETARSAHNKSLYNGNKICNFLDNFEYREIETTIKETCEAFKTQK